MSQTGREESAAGSRVERAGGSTSAQIERALVLLDGLEGRPVTEHPAIFESVHGTLRAVLSGDSPA